MGVLDPTPFDFLQGNPYMTDLVSLKSAFGVFLTPPPSSGGNPLPGALEAEELNLRVGYVMYPTLRFPGRLRQVSYT